jgi:hypothetical protein
VLRGSSSAGRLPGASAQASEGVASAMKKNMSKYALGIPPISFRWKKLIISSSRVGKKTEGQKQASYWQAPPISKISLYQVSSAAAQSIAHRNGSMPHCGA